MLHDNVSRFNMIASVSNFSAGTLSYGGGQRPQVNRSKGGVDLSRSARHVNAAICQAAHSGGIDGLLDVVFEKQAFMDHVNLSTALHRLARLTKETGRAVNANDHRFCALRTRTRAELELQLQQDGYNAELETLPRCWATIAWAYGTLLLRDMEVDTEVSHILNIIGQLSFPRLTAFKPFELSNLLWAYGKARVSHLQLFQAARGHIVAHLQEFCPFNLTTVVWAFVTARYQPSGMLLLVTEQFGCRLPAAEVQPVELANLLWGVATAKLHPRVELLNELGFRVLRLLPTFKHHEFTITLWALSRLGLRHDNLFSAAVCLVCSSQVLQQQVQPQGIANIVWAFEKQLSLGSGVLPGLRAGVRALLPRCLQLLTQTKSKEFACILHGVSILGTRWGDCPEADTLFNAATSVQERVLHQSSLHQCATLYEAVTVFCQSTNPMPHAFAQFCQSLAALCLVKLDAGSRKCPGSSGEAAGMYAISLVRLASAAASTTLPGDANLSGLILARTARCLLQIELDLLSEADIKQLASAYGCLQDDLDIGTLEEALLCACSPWAERTSMLQAYSMPTQTNTHTEHGLTQCATEEACNESVATPATYFEEDIGCGSSNGDVDFECASTGFQVEDTQGLEAAQPYPIHSGTADRQMPFNADPWFEQQVFNSWVLLDQAASHVPAGNCEDSVQSVADHRVGNPHHAMLVKNETVDGASLSGTTVSSDRFRSGECSTVVCQEVHSEFYGHDKCALDNHRVCSTNEHLVMGPAAYTVKNSFIDTTDPKCWSARAAASRFHTEQPVPNFLHHHTAMQSTESWIQEVKQEINLRQPDNTSSTKVEGQDNKTGQSSRKDQTSFFKQVMRATSSRDLLGNATSSSKAASSRLLPNTSHQRLMQEKSDQLPQGNSLATEIMSEACGPAVRGDVNITLQQMQPIGLCEACPSESFSRPGLVDTHGHRGTTTFGQHLPNSNTVASTLANIAKSKVKNTFIETCEADADMEVIRLAPSRFWSDEPSL